MCQKIYYLYVYDWKEKHVNVILIDAKTFHSLSSYHHTSFLFSFSYFHPTDFAHDDDFEDILYTYSVDVLKKMPVVSTIQSRKESAKNFLHHRSLLSIRDVFSIKNKNNNNRLLLCHCITTLIQLISIHTT